MFDKEQSDAFVLGLEGMNEGRISVLVLRSLLEWGEQLHHFSIAFLCSPHERGDAILVCRVLVRNYGLGGFCVPIPESPVERCDFDYPSSPSRVQ